MTGLGKSMLKAENKIEACPSQWLIILEDGIIVLYTYYLLHLYLLAYYCDSCPTKQRDSASERKQEKDVKRSLRELIECLPSRESRLWQDPACWSYLWAAWLLRRSLLFEGLASVPGRAWASCANLHGHHIWMQAPRLELFGHQTFGMLPWNEAQGCVFCHQDRAGSLNLNLPISAIDATCVANLVQDHAERLLIFQRSVWIQYFEFNTDFCCFLDELWTDMLFGLHNCLPWVLYQRLSCT